MNSIVNKMVSTIIAMTVMVSLTGSMGITAVDNTIIEKTYTKYIIADDDTDTYTLTMDVDYSTQPRAIIDEDNRVRVGNSGIVYLSCGGTGFIIGDHTIATAAHCVNAKHTQNVDIKNKYRDYEYFCYDINLYLYDSSGNLESGIPLTPIEFHVPNEYLENDDYGTDFALITVAEELKNYTQFGLGVPYDVNSSSFADLDLFVTGVPGTIPDDTKNRLLQEYTGKGKEHPNKLSNSEVLYYTCDTVGGVSGAPVYIAYEYISNNTTHTIYTAIAVHNGGTNEVAVPYNYGSAMTPYKIQFYKNNPNISY